MTFPLFAGHFQNAYVVEDMDRGIAYFRDSFGVAEWTVMDTAAPGSPATAIAVAYTGDLMLELIQPSAEPSLYRNWVPTGGSGMRFHHLGFLVQNDAEWQAALRNYDAHGYATAASGSVPDLMDYHYADTRAALGYYCELIHLREGGKALFASVPRN